MNDFTNRHVGFGLTRTEIDAEIADYADASLERLSAGMLPANRVINLSPDNGAICVQSAADRTQSAADRTRSAADCVQLWRFVWDRWGTHGPFSVTKRRRF